MSVYSPQHGANTLDEQINAIKWLSKNGHEAIMNRK
jgi:hypothetical protein